MSRLSFTTLVTVLVILGAGGCKRHTAEKNIDPLREQQLARIQTFFVAKEAQAKVLAADSGKELPSEVQAFFAAGANGDWQSTSNRYEGILKRGPNGPAIDEAIRHTAYWQTILESGASYNLVAAGDPKYTQMWGRDIIESIPAGSIYFGGTDPGRFLITAMCKSQVDADPFFCLTQNALADATYLDYLRSTYGQKIYVPTADDSKKCFDEYLADAQQRLASKQLKPGEDVQIIGGKVQVTGQVAVMAINGLLAKEIFDKNPEREFYIEESFPLDWMYPYLEPHGPILKINRQPLPMMSDKIIAEDRTYWSSRMNTIIGDWLTDETSVKELTDFVEKVYLRKDLKEFKGDPAFIQNEDAQKMFSKLRSSVGGVYTWRMQHSTDPAEKTRMARAAEFSLRQAFVLCPYSPEAVYRYVQLAVSQNRTPDAILVATASSKLDPKNKQFEMLIEQLNKMKGQK